jgi:hypothetical protein
MTNITTTIQPTTETFGILTTLIATLLGPTFSAVCRGDIGLARRAATETVDAYRPRNHADLIAAARSTKPKLMRRRQRNISHGINPKSRPSPNRTPHRPAPKSSSTRRPNNSWPRNRKTAWNKQRPSLPPRLPLNPPLGHQPKSGISRCGRSR